LSGISPIACTVPRIPRRDARLAVTLEDGPVRA